MTSISPSKSQSTVPASEAAPRQSSWNISPTLTSRQVLPDRWTDGNVIPDGLVGKETDPSRMGIFLCLLDERPHLHPSLQALHKHRFQIHGIALPPDPARDMPGDNSWINWRFTEEEQARRKAYLPL
ncbi:hypothetical protein BCR39DRAFT_526658, partial [Naematelia encephala]